MPVLPENQCSLNYKNPRRNLLPASPPNFNLPSLSLRLDIKTKEDQNLIKVMLSHNLPNFFIIGASKSGTTTLYDVLRQHPQIYFSFAKEIQFFSHDAYFDKGLNWYTETFFKDASCYPVRGDASTQYLFWSEKVVPRIKSVYRDHPIKFLAIFRDPVQRAYSWYWHMRRMGEEPLSFEDALAAEEERFTTHWEELYIRGLQRYGYYRGGCYATQLEIYLKTFPREGFLFLLHEDLTKDFPRAISSVLKFLEVDDIELKPVVSNPAAMPRSRRVQQFLLHPSGPFHRIIRVFTSRMPYSLRYRLKVSALRMNFRKETYPSINQETEYRLRVRYTDEILRLQEMIGRDLSHWLPEHP